MCIGSLLYSSTLDLVCRWLRFLDEQARFFVNLDPQQAGDTGIYHNIQITLLIVSPLRMSTTTDGLLGNMLCHPEPLQETLAIIWTSLFSLHTSTNGRKAATNAVMSTKRAAVCLVDPSKDLGDNITVHLLHSKPASGFPGILSDKSSFYILPLDVCISL